LVVNRVSLFVGFAVLLGQPIFAGTIEGRVLPAGVAAHSDFVILIEDMPGVFPVPKEAVVLDQKELRFVPHVLIIQVGTTVEFPNSDPVSHNVFSISPGKRFNLGLYVRGAKRRITFDKPGVVELLCNVHQEMSGYILVLKNPYFSRTGADGSYRITGVPAGEYHLRCWSESRRARDRTIQVPQTGSVTVDFLMGERDR
jgi:plastocyanin